MKDILIGAADKYNVDQIKCWVNSIKQSGFAGDVIMIAYRLDETVIKFLEQNNIQVYQCDHTPWASAIDHNAKGRDTQSHQMRFFHAWVILNGLKQDEVGTAYRYVIMTDVRDVVFQKNPSEFLEGHFFEDAHIEPKSYSIIGSSENIKYEDEQWGLENLYNGFGPYITHHIKSNVIANVGTIAGKFESMKELCLVLYLMGENRYIPNDQSSFNILARTAFKDKIHVLAHNAGWACQVGTTMDPQKEYLLYKNVGTPPAFDGETVKTAEGKPYYLVHQYDRNPRLKEYFERKFG